MKALTELAKRRGFFFQTGKAYGGVGGFYTYGPEGATLKSTVESTWRDRWVTREGHDEIDAPTILPEAVFEASGHLDGFDDLLVECPECQSSHRADHLIEDQTDIAEAESFTPREIESLLAEHEIECPSCGTPLAGEPVEEFNLMFETAIGPGSTNKGYLRPETAQGIFVDFPRLREYARGELPFGVAQIGRAYRNEISPRNAIVRTREFTQAELELFFDPESDDPPLSRVANVEAPLYSAADQDGDGEVHFEAIGEAVESGPITDDWVGYYVGVATEWYERIGIDLDRLRFRQHQPEERAHYATDCWDAEADVSGPGEEPNWIELAGIANRGTYDLSHHAAHTDERFSVFQEYDEPRTVERATVDPDMAALGPEYGSQAADIAAALEELAETDRSAFEGDSVTVELDGETVDVPIEQTGFQVAEVTERGQHETPTVIEPSMGIDRTVYAILVHAYDEDEIDGEHRTVLRLPAEMAPTLVGVFPLMDKDGLGERARELERELRAAGLATTYDDSGAIGRRYRRQDEVGTPYTVTVDYESLETDTVTIRDRDTTEQVRVPMAELPETLAALRDGERTFEQL
ncbi:glycyl-tRNA synthetase [Halodesulfurarchaeum formicicum]|uniref:glycine--tRNA ligase n=1 Tax=Halodesulfurarchaeum formicicum TaxID=1873524 RepID=A0A1D8S1N9_9EURY|nr:glycine--tRNA ligase [Halodesulfurarchaeum formicicum]AOW79253.1 glycyl-tRNA synthetase [Halodesulfurarchaeum formicicum]